MTYTIEGTWSGYVSTQRHVVHREHTRSRKRCEDVRKIGAIYYTDGTALYLRVLEGKSGKAINGYGSLLNDCIRHDCRHVSQLPS